MTFPLQIHAIVLSIFWFSFNFFKLKGMEWISRYKAVFGLFTLLCVLLVVYIYVLGNEAVTPTSFTFKTWHAQNSAQKLYDVIIHPANRSTTGRVHGVYEARRDILTTLKTVTTKTTTTVVSEFGWIKKVNFSTIPKKKTSKESEISAENMLLPLAKAKIHRRIAQLNVDWEPEGNSFLVDLPGLPRPKKGKYLVYLCDDKTTCGGLGDRQRGIMGAFLLALVTKRRYGVRMKSPCDLDNFFSPNKINWTVSGHVMKLPFSDYINAMDDAEFKRGVMKGGDFNDNHMEDVIFMRNNMDFAGVLLKHPKYKKLLPEWVQSNDRSVVFRKIWNLLFKPSGSMKVKLNAVTKQIDQSPYKELVCAHARIGRNPTIPDDQTNFNSIQSVKRLWNFLHGYGKNVSYFIATDAEQVREMAKREFGSRLLVTGGKIRHIDRQRNDNDVCDGFETALLEQQILSKCDVLVVSQSGFSIYAAYMRGSSKDLFKFNEGQITPFVLS